MRDVKKTVEPEVPLEVQNEIRRQIRDIVERYAGRRPPRILRRSKVEPPPAPAPGQESARR